jgi:3-oxoadipate enol-lactonase
MPYHTVNGIRLYYEWHGQPRATPTVFINGLLADTTGWAFQRPAFPALGRVLLYDCRGQGQSDKPDAERYPTRQHVDDLVTLLQALNITRANIVGLSNGGAIALSLAAQYPHYVARLVIAATYAHTDTLMAAKLQSWLQALDQGGPAMRFDIAIPWVWGRTFLHQHQHAVASLRQNAAHANPTATRALIAGALDYDIRPRLPSIPAATLVLVGEEDLLTPPWYAHEIASALPNAQRCLVPNAGHALPIEQPAMLNALTVAFLTQTQAQTQAQEG